MARLGLVEILTPFLQLTKPADSQGQQTGTRLVQLCPEVRVYVEDGTCLATMREQVPDERQIHGRSHADAGNPAIGGAKLVLGGVGRAGDEVAAPVIDEPVQTKLGRL